MTTPNHFSPSRLTRRQLIQSTAPAAALAPVSALAPIEAIAQDEHEPSLPPAFDSLKPLGSRVKPISTEEFQSRIARAQKLLAEQNPRLDALFVAPGTSLFYFTGVHWWPSERLLGILIPQKRDAIVVCPA